MQAVIVRPLSSVSALVRFSEEPQMFAVEFNDGCPIHVSPFCLLVYYCKAKNLWVLAEGFRRLLLKCYHDVRCMLAPLVIAYSPQFWMFCKLK